MNRGDDRLRRPRIVADIRGKRRPLMMTARQQRTTLPLRSVVGRRLPNAERSRLNGRSKVRNAPQRTRQALTDTDVTGRLVMTSN